MQATSQEICAIISQFIHRLHETGDTSISHVTVTVHGELQHFVPDRRISHFAVNKMEGVAELSYQDMELEAPIANMITFVATAKKPRPI